MSIKAHLAAAIIGVGALFMSAAPAQALFVDPPAGTTFTGLTYSAPFGAAHRTEVEGDLEASYPTLGDIFYVGRLQRNDDGTLSQTVAGTGFTGALSGSCVTTTNCSEGTWSFSNTQYLIAFLEISTAGEARVYELTPFALLGDWNTAGFGTSPAKNLSHMDFYAVLSDETNVPEPGVLLLLGIGMAGLAGVRLRRRASEMVAG